MQSILKKSTIVLAVFLLISLSFPATAHAQMSWWCNIFPSAPICSFLRGGSFGEIIANVLVGLTTFIPATIFFVVGGITNWLIGIVIDIPIVPGASPIDAPAFVKTGFDLTRQLANMFFLLILVFIGLATILRLQEYQLQRTLPKLILIALLVNFSALLVGFVVDVANIATNFFLSSIRVGGGLNLGIFENIFFSASLKIDEIFASGADHALMQSLALGVVLFFFYLFAALAYGAIAIIFFLRLIILWTLVILAPLAFLAYILPATKKWWAQWLNALIQWSFIAVPISFFMWLANMLLRNPYSFTSLPTLTGQASFAQSIVGSLLAPLTALVLLGIGITMSLAIGPGIVSKAVNTGKKIATIGAGALGGLVAHDLIQNNLAKSARAQALAQRMENFSSRGMQGRNVFGQTAGRMSAPLVRWAGRRAGAGVQAGLKRDVAKAETEAKNWSAEETASKLRGNVSFEKKLGWLNAKIKAGEINDVVRAGFDEARIQPILNRAINVGQHQDIEAAFPHLVGTVALQTHERYGRLREAARARHGIAPGGALTDPHLREELLRRMKPERAKQITEGILEDTPQTLPWQEAMLRAWGGSSMGSFIGQHREEGVRVLEQRLEDLASTLPLPPATDPRVVARVNQGRSLYDAQRGAQMQLWLEANHNNPLAKYLQSQAGQQLGFNV